jgi:hypothetical protein
MRSALTTLIICNAERHSSPSTQLSVKGALCVGGLSALLSLSLQAPLALAAPPTQRAAEMEFDARVIQGQRAEGAVYLFQRAQRPLPPLLSFQRDYIGAITRPVLGVNTPASKALTPAALTRGAAFVVRPYAEVSAQQAAQGGLPHVSASEASQGTQPATQAQKTSQRALKTQRQSSKRPQRKVVKTQRAKRKRARKGRSGR